jgi:hypothetical protein
MRGLPLLSHLRVLTPMSMVLEMVQRGRKAGHVCSRDYRNGPSCPLILRTTSEDAMTANVFGILRRLRPSLWLRPLLNHAFALEEEMTNETFGLVLNHGELDILDDEPKSEVYDSHHLDFASEDES